MIDKNFDFGICTYSTSIESLKPYINKIYNIDDTIVEYRIHIFKLLFLYELAKKINYNLKVTNSSLTQCFNNYYNLQSQKYIIFDTFSTKHNDIVVKSQNFAEADMVVTIYEEAEFFNNMQIDKLYFCIKNNELKRKIMDFNFDFKFSLAKIKIETKINILEKGII